MPARTMHTLIVNEEEQLFEIYRHDPKMGQVFVTNRTFDQMREMGFDTFSRILGENLIFDNPVLFKLFKDDTATFEPPSDIPWIK